MEQNDDLFRTETNLNGVRGTQMSLEAPKKKKNKLLIILIALIVIVAVGGATVMVVGPSKALNQIYKTFKSESKYYSWLEQQNSEALLDVFFDGDGGESNVIADINLSLGSSIANLLSMKDPVTIHAELNQKDQQMLGDFLMTYKGNDAGEISAYINKSENKVFIKAPELSNKFVTMGASNGTYNLSILGAKKAPEYIAKYLGILVDEAKLTLEHEKTAELTIGSTTVQGYQITATYPMADTLKKISNIFTTMKSDEKLQETLADAGITKSAYRLALDSLSTKASDISSAAKETDHIVMICYVDDSGAIVGREMNITTGDSVYKISYIITGETIAVSFGLSGMDYVIAECSYQSSNKSNEFEAVTQEDALTVKEYRKEGGTDFASDLMSQTLEKLGLSQAEKIIDSFLGFTNKSAGTFEFTLGEYMGLTISVPKTEITDEDIEDAILNFVQYDSKMLPITDHDMVEDGDYISIDFVGTVDGKEFEYGSTTDYELEVGNDSFLEGFDAQLIGKKVGETTVVTVTLPSNYVNEDVAGKEAKFEVTINGIGVRQFTDEFVAYNTDYNTTDEYREYLYEGLEENKEYDDQSAVDDAILVQIIDNSTFQSVDQSEIDAKEEEMQDTYSQAAAYYGVDLETFASSAFGMTLDEFNEQISYYAEQYVKESYVLAEIAKLEGLELTEEEYQELAAKTIESYEYESVEQLEENNGGREKVEQALLEEKVLDYLRDHTTIEYSN